MKIVLALAAAVGLSATGAFAACGHDQTAQTDAPEVASVDDTTTASTTPVEPTKGAIDSDAPVEGD